jgi:hypothetical protein
VPIWVTKVTLLKSRIGMHQNAKIITKYNFAKKCTKCLNYLPCVVDYYSNTKYTRRRRVGPMMMLWAEEKNDVLPAS